MAGDPAGKTVERMAPALRAPASPQDGDLDLHLAWRAADVQQDLPQAEQRWSFGQYYELVVLNGEAHRALLMVPSRDGHSTLARFRIVLPVDVDCELVTWVALEPEAGRQSDGVDFAAVVQADAATEAVEPRAFTRLEAPADAWREVRVDLSRHRGATVWVVLAARERGVRAGDWLLWGDPRIQLVDRDERVVVDLNERDSARQRPRSLPWSEVNVFKAYARFNDEHVASERPDWIGRLLPWVASLRLFSSLGGNWGPSLETDYEAQMGKNPTSDARWEARWAKQYEFFRDGPKWQGAAVATRFEWAPFDRLMDHAASSGLALHVHMAGAPELFTGHAGHYHTYHYNERPVIDEAGWKAYVDAVFAHVATRPWFPAARFSFFSEPNCMWVDGDGTVRHFGYQGDAAQYARQYLWTWQAMKGYLRPGQVHLGPWVVEPDPGNPVVDNLPGYLRAIRDAFARADEPLPSWAGFAFNVYETPQLTLDGFASKKIGYVRDLLAEEFPDRALPLRLDEVGLHPLVQSAFERAVGQPLDDTRWAAAWHAEMLALLLAEGIAQAGPWLAQLSATTYVAYLFASRVVHGLDYTIARDGEITVSRPTDRAAAPADVWVALAATNGGRVGYLWSSNAETKTFRLAIWRYPRFAMSDARVRERGQVRPVEILLPSWRDAAAPLTITTFATPRPATDAEGGAPTETAAMLPRLSRVTRQATDRVTLDLREVDLYLLEAE